VHYCRDNFCNNAEYRAENLGFSMDKGHIVRIQLGERWLDGIQLFFQFGHSIIRRFLTHGLQETANFSP